MRAIISTTLDDQYLFFLPIAVWSWQKIGVNSTVLLPDITPKTPLTIAFKTGVVVGTTVNIADGARFKTVSAPDHKLATCMQCARLYAAANWNFDTNEILITSDVDMAVFGDYFQQANTQAVQIFGADLVPENQYPMCYISAPVHMWREFMNMEMHWTIQEHLDHLLGPIECEHFRANQWALDQDTAWRKITAANLPIIKHNRANYPHKFATRRADRDGWPDVPAADIIDAHLPRPGYTPENFAIILSLFQHMYPNENFDWMVNYHSEYSKFLKVEQDKNY